MTINGCVWLSKVQFFPLSSYIVYNLSSIIGSWRFSPHFNEIEFLMLTFLYHNFWQMNYFSISNSVSFPHFYLPYPICDFLCNVKSSSFLSLIAYKTNLDWQRENRDSFGLSPDLLRDSVSWLFDSMQIYVNTGALDNTCKKSDHPQSYEISSTWHFKNKIKSYFASLRFIANLSAEDRTKKNVLFSWWATKIHMELQVPPILK